ncbi:molybdenum cofactor biosynthesis protein MoaE [Methermicoccus shengliensis]|uniref:Molybdenum cofactor biosynthesis protein MoaE n=1 Tax=Methermicoccus shengliensis TaxID=660064 RepID=A0A832RVY2_9EURY|nr:molybdenum cofactor biosynthesis protein MoaE [Methermicoccus shengliensis]KUK05019.1 MAG: Molybdopterin biosynthesis MoaE protein [Euryarchaeota archaeon 55_53]KUK30229.1 MAG: Molybdopterin biosynthesis MoaE protein [Methanosarcinales archeaon 56_1174]MDI3487597.1 molybdopterin synthase catalytic subunit [Methanosarcinales archaeon]MDN5294746.1 molybdopterin synthase catalytic subunit [Methanosarcinales archaeon]HIH69459.1 molybdenum cofactor biosynthesis protein MoaE [Methermicoccus sheng
MEKVMLTKNELPIEEVLCSLDATTGAVVSFIGIVKGMVKGRKVKWIELEVDEEVALHRLEEIRQEALSRYAIHDAIIAHRHGRLGVGEGIVLIATLAEHREAAFEACRYIIEELKHSVPIWKKECTEDGEYWVEGV